MSEVMEVKMFVVTPAKIFIVKETVRCCCHLRRSSPMKLDKIKSLRHLPCFGDILLREMNNKNNYRIQRQLSSDVCFEFRNSNKKLIHVEF